jgi:protein-S-isoprenylcysteine O-methyltransferase Ste14
VELIGTPSIQPALFYSGKMAGYSTWILLGLEHAGVRVLPGVHSPLLDALSLVAVGVAALFIVMSAVSLGASTRLGLPTGETVLKTGGIYRFSRNPMYVGFNALTLAAVLGTGSVVTLALGVYSIAIYHRIIRAEERYLADAFGEQYAQYRAGVYRYLGLKGDTT